MAVHQYIGARYVPYYYENSLDPTSTEWEPNVNYEALTVVTLPNQHSYISKKAVPDTIGSPALNPEYWLDTGSDSAYIQALQDQIDDMQDGTIPGSLQNQIDGKMQEIPDRHFLFMGDSYDTIQPGTSWIDNCALYLGLDVTHYEKRSAGGRGFAPTIPANTWLNYLMANPVADADAITDIVICGGANDVNANSVDILSGMTAFDSYVRGLYPNLKHIYIGFIGWQQTITNRPKMYNHAEIYRINGTMLKWAYLTGVNNIMKFAGYIDTAYTDYQHPTVDGVKALGYGIANAILTGTTHIQNMETVRYTPNSSVITLNTGVNIDISQFLNDDICYLQCGNVGGQAVVNLANDLVIASCAPNQNSIPCNRFMNTTIYDATDGKNVPCYLFYNDVGQLSLHVASQEAIPAGHFFRINAFNATQIMM